MKIRLTLMYWLSDTCTFGISNGVLFNSNDNGMTLRDRYTDKVYNAAMIVLLFLVTSVCSLFASLTQ